MDLPGCPECGWNDTHSPQCSRAGTAAPPAARLVDPPLEALIAKWRKRADEMDANRCELMRGLVVRMCADDLETLQAGRLVDPSPLDIERELRMEWWLNHGLKCMPYGDDGEMQCCGLDFKRMPLDELRPRVNELRLKRISESIQQAARVEPAPAKYTADEDLPCELCRVTIHKGEQVHKVGDWKGHEPHGWAHISHALVDPSPPAQSSLDIALMMLNDHDMLEEADKLQARAERVTPSPSQSIDIPADK